MFSRLDPMAILYSLPAIFLALSFHEFAHAYVASRLGDPTPQMEGRLTLDPMSHIDPVGLILFILVGFGWAKPVKVNPSYFRNARLGDLLVSVAGPLANLFLAFLSLSIIYISVFVFKFEHMIFTNIMWPIVNLNLVFMVLNFLPIPPLDGFHIAKNLLFRRYGHIFWNIERYGSLIFILLLFTGVMDTVISKGVSLVFNAMNQFYILIFNI